MVTLNDRAVLNVIFNPEEPTGNDFIDDNQVAEDEGVDAILKDIDPSLLDKVKSMEKEAVIDAEAGRLSLSLERLDEGIKLVPMKASLYNNRAQVYQLAGRSEDAMADVEEAIRLSKGKGIVAMNAHTQRAVIRIKEKGFHQTNQEAIQDLKMAASLGSDFAKKLLVKFNPYSALCNNMLNSMMKELNGV